MKQARHATPVGKTPLGRFKLFLNLVIYPNPGFHDCIISSCQINFNMSSAGLSITQIEVIAFQKYNLSS